MNALHWMLDENLCGRIFAGSSWLAGRALVASIFGLPMTAEMFALYAECTRRTVAPTAPTPRAMVAAGRGGGKTLISAFVTVYLAASRNWSAIMGPGELVTAAIICPDRRQARVAMRYVCGLLRGSPMLAQLVVGETAESVSLSTGCVLEVHTASFKSTRGYSFCVVVVDESAFLPVDYGGVNADVELVRAVLPGLARVPGSLLLAISSPYAKKGVLFDAFQRHHGVDDAPVLTWQAATRTMNPTIPQTVIDDAMRDDAASARSEWLAQWRDDLESFIDIDRLRAGIVPGRVELPPAAGNVYVGALDAALGSGRDSFTACVLHRTGDRIVVDKLVEIRPPFSPNAAIAAVVQAVRPYSITSLISDRFAKDFVTDGLRGYGLAHHMSEHDRSSAYLSCLPWLTGCKVELPDPAGSPIAGRLISQLANLQRRTLGTGKDAVDHPRSGHDDLSNVFALAVAATSTMRGAITVRRIDF
jgi:hypothetical protein